MDPLSSSARDESARARDNEPAAAFEQDEGLGSDEFEVLSLDPTCLSRSPSSASDSPARPISHMEVPVTAVPAPSLPSPATQKEVHASHVNWLLEAAISKPRGYLKSFGGTATTPATTPPAFVPPATTATSHAPATGVADVAVLPLSSTAPAAVGMSDPRHGTYMSMGDLGIEGPHNSMQPAPVAAAAAAGMIAAAAPATAAGHPLSVSVHPLTIPSVPVSSSTKPPATSAPTSPAKAGSPSSAKSGDSSRWGGGLLSALAASPLSSLVGGGQGKAYTVSSSEAGPASPPSVPTSPAQPNALRMGQAVDEAEEEGAVSIGGDGGGGTSLAAAAEQGRGPETLQAAPPVSTNSTPGPPICTATAAAATGATATAVLPGTAARPAASGSSAGSSLQRNAAATSDSVDSLTAGTASHTQPGGVVRPPPTLSFKAMLIGVVCMGFAGCGGAILTYFILNVCYLISRRTSASMLEELSDASRGAFCVGIIVLLYAVVCAKDWPPDATDEWWVWLKYHVTRQPLYKAVAKAVDTLGYVYFTIIIQAIQKKKKCVGKSVQDIQRRLPRRVKLLLDSSGLLMTFGLVLLAFLCFLPVILTLMGVLAGSPPQPRTVTTSPTPPAAEPHMPPHAPSPAADQVQVQALRADMRFLSQQLAALQVDVTASAHTCQSTQRSLARLQGQVAIVHSTMLNVQGQASAASTCCSKLTQQASALDVSHRAQPVPAAEASSNALAAAAAATALYPNKANPGAVSADVADAATRASKPSGPSRAWQGMKAMMLGPTGERSHGPAPLAHGSNPSPAEHAAASDQRVGSISGKDKPTPGPVSSTTSGAATNAVRPNGAAAPSHTTVTPGPSAAAAVVPIDQHPAAQCASQETPMAAPAPLTAASRLLSKISAARRAVSDAVAHGTDLVAAAASTTATTVTYHATAAATAAAQVTTDTARNTSAMIQCSTAAAVRTLHGAAARTSQAIVSAGCQVQRSTQEAVQSVRRALVVARRHQACVRWYIMGRMRDLPALTPVAFTGPATAKGSSAQAAAQKYKADGAATSRMVPADSMPSNTPAKAAAGVVPGAAERVRTAGAYVADWVRARVLGKRGEQRWKDEM